MEQGMHSVTDDTHGRHYVVEQPLLKYLGNQLGNQPYKHHPQL